MNENYESVSMRSFSPVEFRDNIITKEVKGMSLLDLVAEVQDYRNLKRGNIPNIMTLSLDERTYSNFVELLKERDQ